MARDFVVELAFGTAPELTAALVDGRVLVESRQPMVDVRRALLDVGGAVGDFLRFVRDGRPVGFSRIPERRADPAPAPTVSAPKKERRH
jgi:hypothetical protein